VLLGVVSSIILLSGRYDELATLVIFPSWILYGMTAASVIVLRRKRPDMYRPYRSRAIQLFRFSSYSWPRRCFIPPC